MDMEFSSGFRELTSGRGIIRETIALHAKDCLDAKEYSRNGSIAAVSIQTLGDLP